MSNRSSIFSLATIATLAVAALAPTDAFALYRLPHAPQSSSFHTGRSSGRYICGWVDAHHSAAIWCSG